MHHQILHDHMITSCLHPRHEKLTRNEPTTQISPSPKKVLLKSCCTMEWSTIQSAVPVPNKTILYVRLFSMHLENPLHPTVRTGLKKSPQAMKKKVCPVHSSLHNHLSHVLSISFKPQLQDSHSPPPPTRGVRGGFRCSR